MPFSKSHWYQYQICYNDIKIKNRLNMILYEKTNMKLQKKYKLNRIGTHKIDLKKNILYISLDLHWEFE